MNLKKELEDFNRRVSSARIDERGMICLGDNKIHPDSPFGQELIKKNKHIEKQLEGVNEVIK